MGVARLLSPLPAHRDGLGRSDEHVLRAEIVRTNLIFYARLSAYSRRFVKSGFCAGCLRVPKISVCECSDRGHCFRKPKKALRTKFSGRHLPRFPLPLAVLFAYILVCAVVVVEGATHSSNLVVECATMLVIGIILSIFGIGFLCWLMFNLAVYALPFFAGMTAGLAAYHNGAGVLGLLVGFAAGAITLVIGRAIFAAFASPLVRGLVALVFAAPASVAGYHATLALARIGVPAEGWQEAFAFVGAIAVGATAVVRIAAMAYPSGTRRGSVTTPTQPRVATTARTS